MSRKRQQPSHNDDDDPDYQLALRLSAEMNDTPAPGPMNKTSPQQGYDDDADFALALQLQFESENNSVPRNDHAFASSGEYASKAASVATSIWPSSSSNKAGKNTTSYNEQTAAAKNFSSVTDFVQYVRAARCRKCNDVYFRSGLDVSKVHEQWKHSRGTLSSQLKCRKCSSTTCIACSQTSSNKVPSVNIKGKQVSWCCDTGRLLLIWVLLCAFDENFAKNKSKDATSTRPSQASSKTTRNQNGRYDSGALHGEMDMFYRGTSAMPKGMGFGGDGFGYDPHSPSLYDGGKRPGRNVVGMANHSKVTNAQRAEDEINTLYLELLDGLLPSFDRESSFDFDPPAIVSNLLLESRILSYCAELLRNDSVEDATTRKSLYQTLINFLRTLGAHYATANSTLYCERPLKDDKSNLLASSFSNKIVPAHEKGVPLFDVLKSLSMQSNLVLQNARRNEKEFHNNEGQDLLLVCQIVADLYKYLEANAGKSRSGSNGVSTKAIPALDAVPDGKILEAHHFASTARALQTSLPGRAKRLITEITKLQTGLPPGIYVRHAESRLDIQKWIIIGPADTPYENGIFEFDVFCDYSFPNKPPMVHFRTTGGGRVSFNPNLYPDGKVCLSLLGTWQGEPWVPNQSTLLQVLISIQGLILCEEPWYNEPGREASYRKGTDGPSKSYNQVLQQDTIRTAILGWTDQTPSIWKDVVDYHFQSNSNKILQSAEKWLQAKSLLASGGHGLGGFGMFPAEMPPGIPPMAHLGHSVRHKEEPGDLLARLQNAMKKYGATHVTKVLPKSTTKDQPATEPWKPAALPLHNAMSPSLSGWFPPQGSPSFSNPASSPFGLSSLGPVNVLGVGGNQPVMESTPNQAYPPTATPYGRGGYVLGGQPASRGGYTPMASPTYPPGLGPQDSSGQVRGGNGQGGRGTPSTRGRGGHRGRNPWL